MMTLLDRHPAVEETATGTDTKVLFPEARRRERRRRLGATLAVLLVAGTAGTVVGIVGLGGTRAPSTSQGEGRTIEPGARAWSQALVVSAVISNEPVALPGTPYAYAIEISSLTSSLYGHLVRIDLATGRTTAGPRLPGASDLFSVGSSMVVMSPRAMQRNGLPVGPFMLRLVRGTSTTLTPGLVVHLPGFARYGLVAPATANPALSSGVVWLPAGKSIALVKVATGAVLQIVHFSAPVAGESVDPSGRNLFVALNEEFVNDLANPATLVVELNAMTGQRIAQTGVAGTLGPADLTAVQGGVWVSARGGMEGTSALFRASGKRLVLTPGYQGTRFPPIPRNGASQTMGIWAARLGGNVWLTSQSGASCVDPATGRFRAGTAFVIQKNGIYLGWWPFATWHGLLYGYRQVPPVNATEVIAVRPASACAR